MRPQNDLEREANKIANEIDDEIIKFYEAAIFKYETRIKEQKYRVAVLLLKLEALHDDSLAAMLRAHEVALIKFNEHKENIQKIVKKLEGSAQKKNVGKKAKNILKTWKKIAEQKLETDKSDKIDETMYEFDEAYWIEQKEMIGANDEISEEIDELKSSIIKNTKAKSIVEENKECAQTIKTYLTIVNITS